MTKREKIARAAAKVAALETYKAVLNAPTKKVASISKGVQTVVDIKAVAKSAAAASYNAIAKIAQEPAPQSLAPARTLERVLDGMGLGTLGNLLRGEMVDLNAVEAELATAKASPELTDAEKGLVLNAARKAGANI